LRKSSTIFLEKATRRRRPPAGGSGGGRVGFLLRSIKVLGYPPDAKHRGRVWFFFEFIF